jgi:hypothetical protein
MTLPITLQSRRSHLSHGQIPVHVDGYLEISRHHLWMIGVHLRTDDLLINDIGTYQEGDIDSLSEGRRFRAGNAFKQFTLRLL